MKTTALAVLLLLTSSFAVAARRHPGAAKPATSRVGQIQAMYNRGTLNRGFAQIADPEKAKPLRNTKAFSTYQSTLEGDLVTDGDHLVFKARAKSGEWLVATRPEDSSQGDGLWVFDKTGMKQLAEGTAFHNKIKLKPGK